MTEIDTELAAFKEWAFTKSGEILGWQISPDVAALVAFRAGARWAASRPSPHPSGEPARAGWSLVTDGNRVMCAKELKEPR